MLSFFNLLSTVIICELTSNGGGSALKISSLCSLITELNETLISLKAFVVHFGLYSIFSKLYTRDRRKIKSVKQLLTGHLFAIRLYEYVLVRICTVPTYSNISTATI